MNQQQINCPQCSTPIFFNVTDLLHGASFSCGKCGTKIALNGDSKDLVNQTMSNFESLKRKTKD